MLQHCIDAALMPVSYRTCTPVENGPRGSCNYTQKKGDTIGPVPAGYKNIMSNSSDLH